jgi:hypothetical protein
MSENQTTTNTDITGIGMVSLIKGFGTVKFSQNKWADAFLQEVDRNVTI